MTTSGSSFVVMQNSFVRLPAWSIRLLVPTGVESDVVDAYRVGVP